MSDFLDWISWNLWNKWKLEWTMRGWSAERRLGALRENWDAYLETVKDKPEGRELQDAREGMAAVFAIMQSAPSKPKGGHDE